MKLTLNDEEFQHLKLLAGEWNLSIAKVIRAIINEHKNNQEGVKNERSRKSD